MILRVCLVIPTYNNPGTIADVVRDALKLTAHPIYIFDDGSDQPVERLVPANPRVQIFRSVQNCGKGATLARAIEVLVQAGFTHMLTVDGDGQHLASECHKLTCEALAHPWDLIIGSRHFATAGDVPPISQFGRKFSNFWVQYQTDIRISDSQSGLRVYPLFHMQLMKFWTKRFDFEIEILIRLIWRNVRVREVGVEVYYPPQNERVSHFDKLWDNVRISLLNTVLVTASLLRSPSSPQKAAASVALGVFVGSTPLFGFHTLIVGLLSFTLRLNALWMWMGSHISNPIFAPLLILSETYVGKHLLGITSTFGAWLAGSLVVGAALGALFGLATFVMVLRTREKKAWSGRMRGGRAGNGFLKVVMKFLGLRWAYACLYFIIPYFYIFAPRARHAAGEYWRVLRPQASKLARQRLCVMQLWVFAQTLLDRAYFGFADNTTFTTRSQGWEHIAKLQAEHKGGVLLNHHGGGWDLAASRIDQRGTPDNLHVVKYTADGYTFDNFKNESQNKRQLSSNTEAQPILRIRELLQTGRLVGLMSDRPLTARFELVPFFGKLAIFDTTPFYLAEICKVDIIAVYGFKAEKNNYDFYAETIADAGQTTGRSIDRRLQTLLAVTHYARSLQRMVERYPTQWFNFFRFWSTVPENIYSLATAQNSLIEELRTPKPEQSAPAPAP